MKYQADDAFVHEVNQNLGIAHKVCRLYFADVLDREDVLQEMMYQLYKSYKSFDGRSKFPTWMYRVCLNTALTYRRKNRKLAEESLDRHHQQIADQPFNNKEEAISYLVDAIGMLSPLNKAIILLYLENLTYEEIANITGLTKSNVSVRLVRIKKELESELKQKIKSIEDVNP
jgi:RNA polymerase sigma factor (sigma-70 family)